MACFCLSPHLTADCCCDLRWCYTAGWRLWPTQWSCARRPDRGRCTDRRRTCTCSRCRCRSACWLCSSPNRWWSARLPWRCWTDSPAWQRLLQVDTALREKPHELMSRPFEIISTVIFESTTCQKYITYMSARRLEHWSLQDSAGCEVSLWGCRFVRRWSQRSGLWWD